MNTSKDYNDRKAIPSFKNGTSINLEEPLNLLEDCCLAKIDSFASLKLSKRFCLMEKLRLEIIHKVASEMSNPTQPFLHDFNLSNTNTSAHEIHPISNNDSVLVEGPISKKSNKQEGSSNEENLKKMKKHSNQSSSSSRKHPNISPFGGHHISNRMSEPIIKEIPLPERQFMEPSLMNPLTFSNQKHHIHTSETKTPFKKGLGVVPFNQFFSKDKENSPRSKSPLKKMWDSACSSAKYFSNMLGLSQEKKKRDDEIKEKQERNSTGFLPKKNIGIAFQKELEKSSNLAKISENLREKMERNSAAIRKTLEMVEKQGSLPTHNDKIHQDLQSVAQTNAAGNPIYEEFNRIRPSSYGMSPEGMQFYQGLKEPSAINKKMEEERREYDLNSKQTGSLQSKPHLNLNERSMDESNPEKVDHLQNKPNLILRSPCYSITDLEDSDQEPNHAEEWRDPESIFGSDSSGSKSNYRMKLLEEIKTLRSKHPNDPDDDIELLKKTSNVHITKQELEKLERMKTPNKLSTMNKQKLEKILYINDKRVPRWATSTQLLRTKVMAQNAFNQYKHTFGRMKPLKQFDPLDFFPKELTRKYKRHPEEQFSTPQSSGLSPIYEDEK